MSLDPKSPSMKLWHRLRAAGASEDEATELMHGYAHELAGRQRAWIDERSDMPWWVDQIPDVIDPQAQQPPVDEYRLSTRGEHDFRLGDDGVQRCARCSLGHARWAGGSCPGVPTDWSSTVYA